jgi:hypothetical protein
MKEQQSYGLKDIYALAEKENIELPTVQRGFVWRPYQIENFWDSLLRGYPVGAFVFAKKEGKLDLLDGQQRATSIYLAFCGQDSSCQNSTFKATTKNLQIFIDLGKPDLADNRKYIFRVITKSHPWGYRRGANQKTLETYKINAARSGYKLINGNYLETPLENFWPHDAIRPVPFSFFLHGNSPEQVASLIYKWKVNTNYEGRKSDDRLFTVEEIWNDTQKMLQSLKVPAIYLDINNVIANSAEAYSPGESKNDEDLTDEEDKLSPVETRDTDEIENLFIRLNSGGTPLRGEELNYSILKANIPIELQRKLEAACSGMFSPARFVTLAFRLFQHSRAGADKSDALSMRIKAKQFQTAIRASNNAFAEYLSSVVEENKISQLRALLSYSPANTFGLPQFIYNSLAEKAPEVMFILLYRLWIMGDKFDHGTNSYRRMLGIITMFLWLGRGGTRRDHSRLLNNVSDKLSEPDFEKFWGNSLVVAARKIDPRTNTHALIKPMALKTLENLIPPKSRYTYADVDKFAYINEEYAPFIYNMLYNRDLLLYVQRQALHIWFADIDYSLLEDSNLPYDWDHIFPQKWVHNKRGIKNELRQWYNTIGNFRAWPYSLNRSDQANGLDEKLYIENEEAFAEDICKPVGLKRNAAKFTADILCKWSACGSEWMELGYSSMKNEEVAKEAIKFIRARVVSIYQEWYKNLRISELI